VGGDVPLGTHTLSIRGAGADGKENVRSLALTITSENAEGDFSISVSPSGGSAMHENSLTLLVIVQTTGGYSGTVALSASGQPAGVDITFSPSNGMQNFSSLMTIRVGPTAPAGTYPITVKGVGSDGRERTASYSLTVTAPVAFEIPPPEIRNTRWLISGGKVKITCEVEGEVTSVVVEWRVDGETRETVMICQDNAAGKWVAEIGPFETGTEVNFSLQATGAGGETWDLGAEGQGYDVSVAGGLPESEAPGVGHYITWAVVVGVISVALGFVVFRLSQSRGRSLSGTRTHP
jgi:hypothetical protein